MNGLTFINGNVPAQNYGYNDDTGIMQMMVSQNYLG